MIPMTNFIKLVLPKPSEFGFKYARRYVRHAEFLVFVQLPARSLTTHALPAASGPQS